MKNVMHSVAAVLAGLVVAFVLISASQYLSHMIYPLPSELKDLDPMLMQNRSAFSNYIANAPIGMFIPILLGYMLASFVGAWVTSLIKKDSVPRTAFVLGAILTFAGFMNLTMFKHPAWFIIVSLPSYTIFAWLGSKMVKTEN